MIIKIKKTFNRSCVVETTLKFNVFDVVKERIDFFEIQDDEIFNYLLRLVLRFK